MRFTALQIATFKRRLLLTSLSAVSVAGVVFWILASPGSLIAAYFQAPITVRDAKLIVGPYPQGPDFAVLRRNGVTTMVSLLDPRLPYERLLLGRERTLAAENGMRLLDFPMGSIFDSHISADYDAEARAAEQAVKAAPGRVYLHSYLGMHSVAEVEALLARTGETTGFFTGSRSLRSADANTLAQASNAYDMGDYRQALRLLLDVVEKSEASQVLAGWADYHLNDMGQARRDFSQALRLNPQSTAAQTGLGYCALREGQVDEAALHFSAVLDRLPKDESALTGLGLARYRQGRLSDAAQLLRASLSIDPNDSDAKSALARIPL